MEQSEPQTISPVTQVEILKQHIDALNKNHDRVLDQMGKGFNQTKWIIGIVLGGVAISCTIMAVVIKVLILP